MSLTMMQLNKLPRTYPLATPPNLSKKNSSEILFFLESKNVWQNMTLIIGASLSETHTSRVNGNFVYVCMYVDTTFRKRVNVTT